MRNINLDREWQFGPGMGSEITAPGAENSEITVSLPHDYMISSPAYAEAPSGSASGYFNAGVGHYSRMVSIPAEWKNDKVFVTFDGVMMNATLNVNGGRVMLHHYGYTPFTADITNYLTFGEDNRLSLIVNPSMQPNSRWYSGAGIFRSVTLTHTPYLRICRDGIYGYTKEILRDEEGNARAAFLMTEVKVANDTLKDHICRVTVRLIDDATGETVVERASRIQVDTGTVSTARIAMTVENPRLWDIDSPNLYRLAARVEDDGIFTTRRIPAEAPTCDEDECLFGIRTVTADPVRGLQINGRTVKLKGGCVHHDNGLLGAVSLYDAEVRRIKKLKEVGFNAIRTTHNPPSSALMEACDRLGMYVFAEAFDAWGIMKQPGDFNMFFESDAEAELKAFMQRDRSHPSIIMWSIGNEIFERGGLGHGYTLAEKLAAIARSMDASRPVSNGICSYWSALDDHLAAENRKKLSAQMSGGEFQNADGGKLDTSWEEISEPFTNGLDIVGYNYMEDKYTLDHEMFPERVILGSENYPKEIGRRWPMVESTPYVIGDFTWTAYDYIGEAGIGKSFFVDEDDPRIKMGFLAFASQTSPFPYRLANDADLDINGQILPQGYYRRIVFGSDETALFAYSPDTYGKIELISPWGFTQCEKNWNYAGCEGKMTRIIVFSRSEEVEILLNGASLGRKKQGEAPGAENLPFSFVFETVYEAGTVTAVSYDSGKEVSRDTLSTAGKSAGIRLTADRKTLRADGHSLIYIDVEVVDADGTLVPDAAVELTAELTPDTEGAACLAGFGSGNPVTDEDYTDNKAGTYRGRAEIILRSGYSKGTFRIKVTGQGLEAAQFSGETE
ncbi:MAG: DUF4982 domain-containing protein [Lachnospiraceae bacterium]|nr:DUF4982 domain-containing protein [Lachnospiraceae bacterium]